GLADASELFVHLLNSVSCWAGPFNYALFGYSDPIHNDDYSSTLTELYHPREDSVESVSQRLQIERFFRTEDLSHSGATQEEFMVKFSSLIFCCAQANVERVRINPRQSSCITLTACRRDGYGFLQETSDLLHKSAIC